MHKEKIKELEDQIKKLKDEADWEELVSKHNIPNAQLAEIKYGNIGHSGDLKKIHEAYNDLFTDFARNSLSKIRSKAEKQWKKKRFTIKIGWE